MDNEYFCYSYKLDGVVWFALWASGEFDQIFLKDQMPASSNWTDNEVEELAQKLSTGFQMFMAMRLVQS
jgi:hypothetical protein